MYTYADLDVDIDRDMYLSARKHGKRLSCGKLRVLYGSFAENRFTAKKHGSLRKVGMRYFCGTRGMCVLQRVAVYYKVLQFAQ